MDFAKQEDVMVSLAEAGWDLIIVDEAHKNRECRTGFTFNCCCEIALRNGPDLYWLAQEPVVSC